MVPTSLQEAGGYRRVPKGPINTVKNSDLSRPMDSSFLDQLSCDSSECLVNVGQSVLNDELKQCKTRVGFFTVQARFLAFLLLPLFIFMTFYRQ